MRIFDNGATDAVVTDKSTDAGEGDVEAVRLGELRSEEALLDFTRRAGFGGEGDREDRGGGWVRLQVEMEEAEPKAAVVAGECGTHGAGVGGAAVKSEGHCDGGEGEDLGSRARDEVVEQNAEDEEERIEELDGSVEFGALLEIERRVRRDEEVRSFSAGKLTKTAAGLAEAGDEFFFREGCEGTEGEDAPADEGFCVFGHKGEDGERERGQGGGFFTGGDDGGRPS